MNHSHAFSVISSAGSRVAATPISRPFVHGSRVIEGSGAGFEETSTPCHVLVVDDVSTERMLLRKILGNDGYRVSEACSGDEAIEMIRRDDFDAVLMDALMPQPDGFEVCRRVRRDLGIDLLPIVMVTSLQGSDDVAAGLECGATDFLTKPYDSVELLARLRSLVTKKRLTDRLDDTESVLFALARMVEAKDTNTHDHCDRLSHMAVAFGRELGCSYRELEALRRGGVLHDIGKLGVPDAVLLKEGPLDEDEWAMMHQHTVIGAELCSPLHSMERTLGIIRHHHEKWDGSGYPDGLAGEDIPYLARVFQILDVYDALSNERPYKTALPADEVLKIMARETADGCWDPELMDRFIKFHRDRPGRLALPNDFEPASSACIMERIIGATGREKNGG